MSELFFGTNEARRDRFGSKENLFNELVSTPQENAHVIEPSRNFGTSLTNRAPSNTVLSNLVHKKAKLHFKNNEENSFGSFQANPSSLALAKNIITKKNVAPKQPLLSSALFNSKDVLSIPIKKKNAGNKRATQQKPIHKRKNHIQQATVPHILVQTGSNVQP